MRNDFERWNQLSGLVTLTEPQAAKPATRVIETRPRKEYYPECDVVTTDEALIVFVDIPGVQKRDLKLQFKDGELVIAGERKPAAQVDEAAIRAEEIPVGKFQRKIAISPDLDTSHASAHYSNGVLRVLILKKKTRHIEVSARTTDGDSDTWIEVERGGNERDGHA